MWSDKNIAWILSLFLAATIKDVQGATLRCYKGSLTDYFVTPLENPMAIVRAACVDFSLPTIVYTFGYRGKTTGPATTAVLNAYINKKKKNVLLLDWEEEAKSSYLGIPLGYALYAVPNAVKLGTELGYALATLAASGLNSTHIHLIGHSLGAHIMAYAGRSARERGYTISRITGLDPARALFEGSLALRAGLDRTCARFVDIVHTDPGGYGTSTSTGTVDIWPNYAGIGATQPGCPKGDYEMFSREDLCSHDRSWQFLVESIASPTAFPAASALDFDSWVASRGSNQTIYVGDLTNSKARGNFFLTTKATAPYSMGNEGLNPDINQIRRRRSDNHNSLTRFFKYLR